MRIIQECISVCIFLIATQVYAIDLERLAAQFENQGVTGRIHGAVADSQQFVLTHRNPLNFFDFVMLSLVAQDEETQIALRKAERHDQVLVKGHLRSTAEAQPHVFIESIQTLEEWPNSHAYGRYRRPQGIPDEVIGKNRVKALVHHADSGKEYLIIDYKSHLFPVLTHEWTGPDFPERNDIVDIQYRMAFSPSGMIHLELGVDPNPLQILDPINIQNDRQVAITGTLLKYPKSPQITLDVYALRVESPIDGIFRTYNIFGTQRSFSEVYQYLDWLWDSESETITQGRNVLRNDAIRLTMRGLAKTPANPQIIIANRSDIERVSSH